MVTLRLLLFSSGFDPPRAACSARLDDSTFMISAPMAPSIFVVSGPAMIQLKSNTRRPDSGSCAAC